MFEQMKALRLTNRLKSRYDALPYELDIVNIGSGPSDHDFDWSAVPDVRGANLAISPEDFRYDGRIVKHYGKHLKKGGIVIAVICPLSFCANDYLYRDSFSEKYVSILPREDVDLPKWKYWLYKHFPAFLSAKHLAAYAVRKIRAQDPKSKKAANPSDSEVQRLVNGWISDNPFLQDLKNGDQAARYLNSFQTKIQDLQSVIQNCVEQDLTPILLLPPMSEELRLFMSAAFLKRFLYDNLESSLEQGVLLLDYMCDERFTHADSYTNGLFLKDTERKRFTKIVWADIEKQMGNKIGESNMSEKQGMYKLSNGVQLPWIAFGTGVIWKYSLNKTLFLKTNLREVLSSVKHRKMNRELKGNLFCKRILRNAFDAGYRMFDSARIYGYSEKFIGDTLSQEEGLFITKCSAMDITRKESPNSVQENLDISLRNFRRDQADLYLLHWPEGNWLDYYAQIIEEYKKGRCRAFGACNLQMEHLYEIEKAGLEMPMVIQTEIHPLNTKRELREYCQEHGILLMAHTPTARAGLGLAPSETMKRLTEKYQKTAVQIILRWHYQNGVIPVVSAFNKAHMEENLNIFDFSLTDSEMQEIDAFNENKVLLNATGIDDPNYIYNY